MLDRLTALFAPRPLTAEAWLARLARPGAGARDQAAFHTWLEASPDHLRQYESAKADMAALEGLYGAFSGDLARLRQTSLRQAQGRRKPTGRRLVLAGGLACAGLAAAAVLYPVLGTRSAGRLYQSAPGRIVDLTLDDGSRVTLDADSAVRVALSDDVRRVTLERGSAYFEVAHAAAHPFQVAVDDRRVIVTGTRFAVSRTIDGGQVSLLEGQVVIGRRDAAMRNALADGLRMAPGEQAVFRSGEPAIVKTRADVESGTSWSRRRLVFKDAPLSEVIAAASRYADAPLVLADPDLSRVRVTAVLPLDDPKGLTSGLTALLPIRAERTADGRVLIRSE